MSWRKFLWLFFFICISTMANERGGGDDAGNGGFAYKQSIKILEMACGELEHKIAESNLKELNEHPDWRRILVETLRYDALIKLPKKNQYRGGRKLAMNYQVSPEQVIVLKPYYEAFMGKTDNELEDAALEVQKRLVHEASHIWGYQEKDSEAFSIRFINETGADAKRPTRAIDIKSDFCACKNGRPDLINNCSNFCSQAPVSSSSVLYLNTIIGPDIALHPKLGNLYNWCNVMLDGDELAPQCFLSATDGITTIENIPVKISKGANSLTANLDILAYNKTYILKIYEGKTGSNAESREFQLRRRPYVETDQLGALKHLPINQYTCFHFGGTNDSNGRISRDSYSRLYYYFASNDIPPPMPPLGQYPAPIVCHDEQLHPGDDSAMYPRLDIVPQAFISWDKTDPRFYNENGTKKIDKIISERLFNEYGINMNVDLFRLINFPNRPTQDSSINSPLGYIMLPFIDSRGQSFCPTREEYHDNTIPLFNVLKEYMDDTEGLYIAEKEAEIINDNGAHKVIYGTMFVTESTLKKVGFYVENGIKIRADRYSLHNHTIYFYWPTNDVTDPLIQGNRKLFTVRRPGEINGNIPTGIQTSLGTTDKRIGCVPKAGQQ